MEIFVYRKGETEVKENYTVADLPALLADESNIVWVDLLAETKEEIAEAQNILLKVFRFHYLTVEDCIETRNQPKVEAFPDYFYFIVHGIRPDTNSSNFRTKELDGYLGKNYVVTFHLERFRSIKAVKQQIRSSTFACQRGAAYLLHQILDQLVDLYMPIVDDFDNSINELEDRVFQTKQGDDDKILEEIMDLRRSVARLKRISTRQLDVLYRISHGEFPQIPENILPFYRDVHDHLLRITDLSENYRDLVAGLFDIHFSVTANKTNDIIKFLTIFSAIWLPLSFIAGVYGMNFETMPELKTRYGYFVVLGVMILVTLSLLFYFYHKGWILQGKAETAKSGKAETPESTEKPDTPITGK